MTRIYNVLYACVAGKRRHFTRTAFAVGVMQLIAGLEYKVHEEGNVYV